MKVVCAVCGKIFVDVLACVINGTVALHGICMLVFIVYVEFISCTSVVST